MIIQLEPQSDIPIYTQLTNQIIEGIATGFLQPGHSLPSVRALAADLGVNMHTVNKSYHELEKKGIISIIPKSGAVVRPRKEISQEAGHAERIFAALRPMIAEALVVGLDQQQIEKQLVSIIHDLTEIKS
ncbi:GntR family transcriptional regulator [Mesobacillus foraminis]|uniref:GntR family transcriptional regulator n=1 Tax=Mesobacillus foraminis TaxID=279826 RepID=UPI000EF517AF|nr:GntR family transcriptional regulator [Mesobacillus foraminis]